MKIQNLSPRQMQTLTAIANHINSLGYSPTIQQLSEQLQISRTTVFGHIAGLREKGLLNASTGKARCLTLTKSAVQLLENCRGSLSSENDTTSIPLIGQIAAGAPIEAIENESVDLVTQQFGNTEGLFALKVSGESMINDGIYHGDYIICKKTHHIRNGQLAVVIVDNDTATVKRFYNQGKTARLEPANDDFEPIITDNCRIEGQVVGLMRKF